VRYTFAPASFARVLVAEAGRGLCFAALNEDTALRQLVAWAREWEPGADVREESGALGAAVEQLVAYGRSELREFDLLLDLRGSDFERAVWDELVAIPFGRTRTYGQLAERVGAPGSARAVGRAAGHNPIPVIVPCHRLLAANGLGGFTGGLHHKRRLLGLEGVPVAHQSEFV
jgi:methylated-DNA-[protein]-cysteine S-methyltransferase